MSKDITQLSDEEIMGMSSPGETPPEASSPALDPEPEQAQEPENQSQEEPEDKGSEQETGSEAEDTKPESEDTAEADPSGSPEGATKQPKVKADSADKKPEEPKQEEAKPTPDYAAFYKQIVETPFKANGKMIEIRSPEEAISLMQMGANYTRKLQELAPVRKIVTMLEKNQLLNEDDLSFLIDIKNKNPDAIKKLVKDSGIDPMEIDVQEEPKYQPGNHKVSDAEVNFSAAMDDLESTDEGKKTLLTIKNHWDDASKDILWDEPKIFQIIHQQRENGVYDRIAAEVDRRKTLGLLPVAMPFLHAYKQVGDEIMGVPENQGQPSGGPATPAKPAVVASQRPAPVKPVVKNNAAAAAASGTRSTPKPARAVVNPLAMSDDDFLKQFANRL